jgi:hypothetical protein
LKKKLSKHRKTLCFLRVMLRRSIAMKVVPVLNSLAYKT